MLAVFFMAVGLILPGCTPYPYLRQASVCQGLGSGPVTGVWVPFPLVFWASRGCVGVPPPWRVPVGDGLELLPPCGHRFVEAVKTGRYKHPRSSRAGVVRRGVFSRIAVGAGLGGVPRPRVYRGVRRLRAALPPRASGRA